jgi:ubiquinone biosynthesis monooxygenase Coq7
LIGIAGEVASDAEGNITTPGDPASQARYAFSRIREVVELHGVDVNHVGEICAQALYTAQAMATKSPGLRRQFEKASEEESDHLLFVSGAERSRVGEKQLAIGAFRAGHVAASPHAPAAVTSALRRWTSAEATRRPAGVTR